MNVILVDDEEVALNALRRRVDWGKYGIDGVYTAGSMAAAQEVFRQKPIDIMLSDIEMPQGDGLELFEWVKLYYPAVECVYVTCHPEFSYIQRALRLGSADYLLKPIDYGELDGILTALVERLRRERHTERIPAHIQQKLEREDREKGGADPVDTVVSYIHGHIQENITIGELAGQVYLNEQYLTRIFKKAKGVSILEYITDERIRLAKELLTGSDYPINRVADAVGYGNYSYFTRIFKRSTGKTPQAWRQSGG
ncbi:MAG: AraC family transcriptional regulator [Oscillospiraceae bacterium]|nr:AraC family transcriptional regulator [Oscillospiraceae bacterium]